VSDVERFVEYALAFEEVLGSDDWSRLEPFFTEDAERDVKGGGPLAVRSFGRVAVIDDLHRGVDELDRRFDERVPEVLSGPTLREGAIWIEWRLNLHRAGLPKLVVEGSHGTWYRDGRICRIHEEVSDACGATVAAYLEQHAAALRPVGGVHRAGAPETTGAPSALRMKALAETYARAKSRADVAGALAVCHEDFELETLAFGLTSHGKTETAQHLEAFFRIFPDYGVTLDGLTTGEAGVGCWGTARMTMQGDLPGIAATGKRVELPFFCAFTFRDGLLASERFFFDLAAFCEGLGIRLDQAQAVFAAMRGAGTKQTVG
jgi:ketosteroid isomerase-like protein